MNRFQFFADLTDCGYNMALKLGQSPFPSGISEYGSNFDLSGDLLIDRQGISHAETFDALQVVQHVDVLGHRGDTQRSTAVRME